MADRTKLPKGYFYRGKVIWCRTDPVTGGQASTDLRDPAALGAWARKRQAEASDPEAIASHGARLGDWVKKIVTQKAIDRSPATVEVYRQKLAPFVSFWGPAFPLAGITPAACDRFVEWARTRVSDHTIVKYFSALSQLLKAAKRVGCYPGDISTLRSPSVSARYKPRKRHLSWAELDALEPECSWQLWAIIVVSVATSARLSEALKFERGDIHNWVAHLRGTKTEGADRWVPVLPRFRHLFTAEVLSELPIGGEPNNLRRDLARACKRAGVENCTPNDLRRTHASMLLAGGASKENTRRMLGHKSSRMVELVYGQLDPKELEALIEGSSYGSKRNNKRNSGKQEGRKRGE